MSQERGTRARRQENNALGTVLKGENFMKSLFSEITGFFVSFLMLALAPSGVAVASQGVQSDLFAGEAIIKFTGPGSPSASELGVIDIAPLGSPGAKNYLVTLDPFVSQGTELARLQARDDVEYAEANHRLTLTASSDDPRYVDGSTWGLYGPSTSPTGTSGSNAAAAWESGYTGNKQVYVAVIDSGIDVSHPDLAANIWVNSGEIAGDGIDNDGNGYVDDVNGYDFLNGDGSVFDTGEHPHGTHVAGTIGAVGGNGVGLAGVAWNVNMISAKIVNSSGEASLASAVEAIDYITDLRTQKGLDIIASNNSWGGTRYSQALEDAIKRGGDAGIMFVAAAGNSAANVDSTAHYPAAYDCSTTHRIFDCVVSVAAIAEDGSLASYSNFGSSSIDIAAPGTNVLSTLPGGLYGVLSGTSMAAPHVTGALALCVASYRGTSGLSAIQKLQQTAAQSAALSGKVVSGGALDVAALVNSCVNSTSSFAGALTDSQATAEYTDRARLDWVDSATGDYEQEIQAAVGPNGCRGSFTHVAFIGPGLDSYPMHNLEEAQFYCFRVRAIKDGAVSAWAVSNVTITWTSNLPFIYGKVLLSDGVTPVANAPVRWLAEGAYAGLDDSNALLAYTNASGEYVIQVSNGTPGELFVGMSRKANSRMTTPTIPWGLRAAGSLTINSDTVKNIILPKFNNINFTLVDENDNLPIAGARLLYAELGDNCKADVYTAFSGAESSRCAALPTGYSSFPAKTDANGQVTIGILDSTLIRATSHMFSFVHPTNTSRITNATVVSTSDQNVRVVMSGSIALSGTAYMDDGVTPIANATVKWLPEGTPRSGENRNAISTTTDSSGQYSIPVTAGIGGQLSLHSSRNAAETPFSAPRLAYGLWAWGSVAAFTEAKSIDLVAPKQHVVQLEVVDQRGAALAFAKVRSGDLAAYCKTGSTPLFEGAVSPGCQAWPSGIRDNVRTDASGLLSLPLLDLANARPDNYTFVVTHPTKPELSTTVSLDPSADMVQRVVISDEVSITGRVLTSEGTAVSGITVKWLPEGTPESGGNDSVPGVKTDANGNYEIKVSAGAKGQLFAWTTRRPSASEQTSPLTPWGLNAGGEITITADTEKDITLPRFNYLNYQVREFGSGDPVVRAKFGYSALGDSCIAGRYSAFPGATDSRCAFWPVGYSTFGLLTDGSGNLSIPVLDRSYFNNKVEYVFAIEHPLDPARVTTSKSRLTATGTVLVEMPGTPSKPEQPDATPLTNEVALSWDEPWNGGAFIDYYKVWVSLNADGPFELVTAGSCAGDIAPELRSCVVTGLTAGVTYYFAIIAHNVVGYSDRSLSISSTPLAAISTFELTPTPSITGVAEVGRALVVVPGAWGSRVELSYQWFSGAQPILGAVGASYLVKPKDSGKSISVSITGRKEGFTTVTKRSTGVLASWPSTVNLVAISGDATPGAILRVQTSELLAGEALTYEWQRDGASISGATQDYFELSSEDVGSSITVKIQSMSISSLPTGSVTDSIEILGQVGLGDEREEKKLSGFLASKVNRWFVQKSIRTFRVGSTSITDLQKAVIKNMVDAQPTADKFICTGIRREGGTMSENLMVRKRAKAACDYAKSLNPELSTWYQSKVTSAPSYVGRVLLVEKGIE